MIGQKFSRLTVLERVGTYKNGDPIFKCLCKCGGIATVISGNLKKGNSKSCGCLRKEKTIEFWSKFNLRHGETNTKLWKAWSGILDRTTCKTNFAYDRYGGAGIGICEEWKTYESFAAYMGQPPSRLHTVDRIDNSKGYEPGNVRWATKQEQAENRKTNKFVVVNGVKVTLTKAAEKIGISKSTASRWYAKGVFENGYKTRVGA